MMLKNHELPFLQHSAFNDLTESGAYFSHSLHLAWQHLYKLVLTCLPSLDLWCSAPSPLHTLAQAGPCLGRPFPLLFPNRQKPLCCEAQLKYHVFGEGAPAQSNSGWREVLYHPQLIQHSEDLMSYTSFKIIIWSVTLSDFSVILLHRLSVCAFLRRLKLINTCHSLLPTHFLRKSTCRKWEKISCQE